MASLTIIYVLDNNILKILAENLDNGIKKRFCWSFFWGIQGATLMPVQLLMGPMDVFDR